MPAVILFGRRWQISTDLLPLFALFAIAFYLLWFVYIIVAFFITVDIHGCNDSRVGRHYLATVCLFLTEYVVSLLTAVCITLIGLRGYGTYVVAKLQPINSCWMSDHRRTLTRVLVYVSWGMILFFDWGRMLVLYNITPDLQRMSSWVWRLRILSWVTGNRDVITKLQQNEDHPLESLTALYTDLMRGVDLVPSDEVVALLLLAAHQRNMRKRHIKRKLAGQSCCQGPPHLCHQQDIQLSDAMTRPTKSQPHNYPREDGQEPAEQDGQAQDIQSKQQQSGHLEQTSTSGTPSSDASSSTASIAQDANNARSDSLSEPLPVQSRQHQHAQQQQRHRDRHTHDDSALGHYGSEREQPHEQPHEQSHEQQQDQHQTSGSDRQQDPGHNDSRHLDRQSDQTTPNKRPTLKEMHLPTGVDVEQGWGRGNDTDDPGSDVDYDDEGDIAVFEQARGCGFPCVITPSSTAAELAPNLTQQQAAQIYLGERQAVDQDTLTTAAKFAKYAIAAYGNFGMQYKDENGIGKQMGSWKLAMGQRFHSYKNNKLVRSKVKTHKQRLHYEAIIQVAQIQDADLLYLNFSNVAMGDVPYIICLDRESQSIVLSIRGTQSLADAATDLLAYPHPLHNWLPDCIKQKGEETMYGHAGMLGAAAAVWEDLRANHLLAALLDLPLDEDCKPHSEDSEGDKRDLRMSRSEKERHMLWEAEDTPSEDLHSSSQQQPAKHAADVAKARTKGRPRFMERGGRHGATANSPSSQSDRPGDAAWQEGEMHDWGECGLSLEQLMHEDVGAKQALRSDDQQNKFVGGLIRRGLYKDGWKLVITGHSLGAGVAAMLALKMHQRAKGVQCWAFCPPGGLLSQNLSHTSEDYITSIIVNKDMVPRMSLKTVYRLFEGKMLALARCNKTATRVLLHALRAGSRRVLLSDPRLFRRWAEVSDEAKDMLHRFQERPAEDSISTLGLQIGLYPPGRQIFLRRFKTQSQPKRSEDVSWDAVWIQPEEIIGEGILVSKHATKDHYPFSLLSALNHVTQGAVGHVKRKTF